MPKHSTHKHKEYALKHDLDGQRFGYLEVIKPLSEIDLSSNRLLECRCLLCGNLTKATRPSLLSGMKKTCGSKKCSLYVREENRRKRNGEVPQTPETIFPPKKDCNCYIGYYRCKALTETLCCTRGDCKFYKPKEKT